MRRAAALGSPTDKSPCNRHALNIACAPGRRRQVGAFANPSATSHLATSVTKRGSLEFIHPHFRAAMHHNRRHGGQLFSDEFLRSSPANKEHPVSHMPPAGDSAVVELGSVARTTNWHFIQPDGAAATAAAGAAGEDDAAEDPGGGEWTTTTLNLVDKPIDGTDLATFLCKIAAAASGGAVSWEAKCGQALEKFVSNHEKDKFLLCGTRSRCLDWTTHFLCPLLRIMHNEVKQNDQVCFIRQVHLLAARVAPLVNMTVHELLSKPGLRKGGFGARVADPVQELVDITQFLRSANDSWTGGGGDTTDVATANKSLLVARLDQGSLQWLHAKFLRDHLGILSDYELEENGYNQRAHNEGMWGYAARIAAQSAAQSAAEESEDPSAAETVTPSRRGSPESTRNHPRPIADAEQPTDAVVVGSVRLVQDLRNAMTGFRATKSALESSIIVGAMRHCYQEVKHTCKALRVANETGLVSLLDKRCPVHTQFVNLVVRFLNFTNRSTGRRPGFDRDMTRHAAAYRQQLFFFKKVRLNPNCENCNADSVVPVCYEIGELDFSLERRPCQGEQTYY